MLVLKMVRSCVLGPGRKAKVHEVVTVELDLAMRLLREKSAVLLGTDDEKAAAATEAEATDEEVADCVDDVIDETEAWTKPAVDDDLVVADEPEPKKKTRGKKG